jgi:hypothetical protein
MFYSPELFSGALCFGGNNVEMPLKCTSDAGVWYSPSIWSSGLNTLLIELSATGFLGGGCKFFSDLFDLLGAIIESFMLRVLKEELISTVRFSTGAQLR